MFDEDRAHKLEKLANIARHIGNHNLEHKTLSEMKKMKDQLKKKIESFSNLNT